MMMHMARLGELWKQHPPHRVSEAFRSLIYRWLKCTLQRKCDTSCRLFAPLLYPLHRQLSSCHEPGLGFHLTCSKTKRFHARFQVKILKFRQTFLKKSLCFTRGCSFLANVSFWKLCLISILVSSIKLSQNILVWKCKSLKGLSDPYRRFHSKWNTFFILNEKSATCFCL